MLGKEDNAPCLPLSIQAMEFSSMHFAVQLEIHPDLHSWLEPRLETSLASKFLHYPFPATSPCPCNPLHNVTHIIITMELKVRKAHGNTSIKFVIPWILGLCNLLNY